jgi:hypothetical protein
MKVVFDDIARFIDDGTTAAQPVDNQVLIDETVRNKQNSKQ